MRQIDPSDNWGQVLALVRNTEIYQTVQKFELKSLMIKWTTWMNKNLSKFTSLSSASLEAWLDDDIASYSGLDARPPPQLIQLLSQKNGFFCFEQALHVYPLHSAKNQNIIDWNQDEGWRKNYLNLAKHIVFFAQNIFGNQFGFDDGMIVVFNPEQGTLEKMAEDREDWARVVLSDFN